MHFPLERTATFFRKSEFRFVQCQVAGLRLSGLRHAQFRSLATLLVTATLCGIAFSADATEPIKFNRDVRPILAKHCFACHGTDQNKREAELRLDTLAGATADLGGYQALVPGNADESELWKRVVATDDSQMPPAEFHAQLTENDRATLRDWIKSGAPYEAHWAFQPPVKPNPPNVADITNPIDAFVRQKLAEQNLEPATEADRATLIRRLSLDLNGLPPSVAEIDAFLADDSENAYEDLVDRLQARVTYGEHMARYWLDLARYADTHGLHLDNERSMWPFRDWVVRAINDNLPFDEFTRWQLAGDLLPSPTVDQLIASGFNRCNVSTSEGGSINDEWIYRYAVDRTATTAEVWMGLTAGCAVCHDHKFDPLSTREFYSLYAFFHSAADPAMDGNIAETPPIMKLIPEDDKTRVAELRSKIAAVDDRVDSTLTHFEYVDPATTEPPLTEKEITSIWFDDFFPAKANLGASGGPELKLVDKDSGPVFSGNLAVLRSADAVVGQDFFTSGGNFVVPDDGEFFVHCYLDPENPPEAVMVQFHTKSWKNRAVWGDAEKIPYGAADTTERVAMGALPRTGEWVKLKFSAAKIGLTGGTVVTGFAFTQFAGTVSWDLLGISAVLNPAENPRYSWRAWLNRDFAKLRSDLTPAMRREFQGRTPETWNEAETKRIFDYWVRNFSADAKELIKGMKSEKAPLEKEIAEIEKRAPATMIMAELKKPRDSFVMLRGAYDQPGESVSPNVPAFLPPLRDGTANEGDRPNRLHLANWLLDRRHPLTARVTVNRVWQQFFGTGLVETSEDFGTQGQLPTHPELLDWLAVQFIDDGWDMKRLIKRIVTSKTYRQSSRHSPELLLIDPANRLLATGPRMRLDAEVLRDQALQLGGLLVPTVGGPGVKPYQPDNIWEPVGFGNSNTRNYKQDTGDSLYRRSIYTFLKRTAPPPFLASFDAPNREQSCSRRQSSNTPMQALQLLNDVQHIEAARGLAERIIRHGGNQLPDRVTWGWRVVTGRMPTDSETDIATQLLDSSVKRFAQDLEAAKALINYGDSDPSKDIEPAELAAHTLFANLLLNLDETVSKN